MNITIITVYNSQNHGSFLQAKALSNLLSNYGEVSFLDENYRKLTFINTLRIAKMHLNGIKELSLCVKIVKFDISEYFRFKKCWKTLRIKSKKSDTDVYVLGSDEIWNIRRRECSFPSFYGYGLNKPIISYAPSINNASVNDFKNKKNYVDSLKNVFAVSVRDNKSKIVIDEILDRNVDVVLDPTLLFDAPKVPFEYHKKYIAVYAFDNQLTNSNVEDIMKFSLDHDFDLIGAGRVIPWCKMFTTSIDGNPFYIYSNASYVICSTFHGTAYAINYHKNFAVFSNGNTKIDELLAEFHLEDRIVSKDNTLENILKKKIDYNNIDMILEKKRNCSLSFVKNAFSNIGK